MDPEACRAVEVVEAWTNACWAATTLIIVFSVGHISGYWRAYRHLTKERL